MTAGDMRRPTDAEQATIASVYAARSLVESKRIEVVAVGMGPDRIEDADGRWNTLLGLPVVTVGTEDRRSLVLLVNVKETAFPESADPGMTADREAVEALQKAVYAVVRAEFRTEGPGIPDRGWADNKANDLTDRIIAALPAATPSPDARDVYAEAMLSAWRVTKDFLRDRLLTSGRSDVNINAVLRVMNDALNEPQAPSLDAGEPDDLGAAWREAEAALPEGHAITELRRFRSTRPRRGDHDYGLPDPAWIALAGVPFSRGMFAHGYGPTPATALRALAATLTRTPPDSGEGTP